MAAKSDKQTAKRNNGVNIKYITLKTLKVSGFIVLLIVLAFFLINALLSVFKNGYYMSVFGYRLFPVVTDAMEPEIAQGNMISTHAPKSPAEISADETHGSIVVVRFVDIDYRIVYVTRRVADTHDVVDPDGSVTRTFITKSDNADADEPDLVVTFDEIEGIFTGAQCGFFGYFFDFMLSPRGVLFVTIAVFLIVVVCAVSYSKKRRERYMQLRMDAIRKCEQALSNVNLRYDNINEITAVMDVLDMLAHEPDSRADAKSIRERLYAFVNAESIALPQTAETAAILESLPAPDNPMSLAAALAAGATLRQAEDGQTLVLTTTAGGKSIMLTPVQTSTGIVLYQQGVRMRAEIAPNIEDVGIMSMPSNPEFFTGQPLEKTVAYPELPQPAPTFGPDALSPHTAEISTETSPSVTAALASPTPVGEARNVLETSKQVVTAPELPTGRVNVIGAAPESDVIQMPPRGDDRADDVEAKTDKQDKRSESSESSERKEQSDPRADEDKDGDMRRAFLQYREAVTEHERKQVEQMRELLETPTRVLTDEERIRIEEYKKSNRKPAKPRAPRTDEQRAAAKAAAEKRKAEKAAFLASLSDEEREIYEAEQKLRKSRAAAIKKLRDSVADVKLLEKLDGESDKSAKGKGKSKKK